MKRKSDYPILTFAGNIITIPECRRVADAIRSAFRDGNLFIAVDFSAVTEISGSFTGFLVVIFKEIKVGAGSLLFFNVSATICTVLETVGMGNLIRNEFSLRDEKPVVLVVEDDPMVRELTREYLLELGYACLEARNGREGLERYEKNRERIAFLVMDNEKPEMDGQQLFEALYKKDPQIRVIMATGYAPTEKIQKIRALKEIEILHKPYFCADLEKAIQATYRKTAFQSR